MNLQLNRKSPPVFSSIDSIEIIKYETVTLSNEIPLYLIRSTDIDVIKIDLIFKAGSIYHNHPIVAYLNSMMLNEGTKKYSSFELAEKIDYFGAFLNQDSGKDSAYVTLYTPARHFEKLLPILEEVIKYPIFPDKELGVILEKEKQQFFIENQKVKTLARAKQLNVLFGQEHPYGVEVKEEHYTGFFKEQLSQFHKKYYHAGNCKIIVSGNISDYTVKLINDFFGAQDWMGKELKESEHFPIISSSEHYHLVEKPDVIQSAIRIGTMLFNKNHPDFTGMQILNTIIGGYFGSRLMKNIREDKGYTYGIGSVMVSLKQAGYFTISTEVKSEVTSLAIKEIINEIKKIQQHSVSNEELALVKNYFLGVLMRMFDGVLSVSDTYRSIIDYDLNYMYFYNVIEKVKAMDVKEIKRLANTYLDEKSLYIVVAGK